MLDHQPAPRYARPMPASNLPPLEPRADRAAPPPPDDRVVIHPDDLAAYHRMRLNGPVRFALRVLAALDDAMEREREDHAFRTGLLLGCGLCAAMFVGVTFAVS